MRVHVAFTPAEAAEAIVVDVVRATSAIARALAAGYERVRDLLLGVHGRVRSRRRLLRRTRRRERSTASRAMRRSRPSSSHVRIPPVDGLSAPTYGPPGLEENIAFCTQVDTLDVVPRFARMVGAAAEIVP